MGDVTVKEAAAKMSVNRATLQRVVNGAARVSADMAFRLGAVFGTSPELWYGMQAKYDLDVASKVERPRIQRITA